MHTSSRALLTVLLILGGLAASAPARAADALVVYDLASPDPSGIGASAGAAGAACGAGCGAVRLRARVTAAAGRQGLLTFSAPPGTVIVRADIRMRWRTAQSGVSARVLGLFGGRWVESRRLRAARGQSGTVSAGRGATAVGVALGVDARIPARRIASDADNAVTVQTVTMTVRDVAPPTAAWAGAAPESGDWQRGMLCGDAAATDAGLGVDRIEYAVGGVTAAVAGGPVSRLQPRPPTLGGRLCVDTAQLPDGTYGTTLIAVDTAPDGNRSAAVTGLVRIDNTPPTVDYRAPADPEARLPEAMLTVADPASGVARLTATVDGIPAVLRGTAGTIAVTPAAPLADGLHRIAWEAVDAAGNATTGDAVIGVLDATAPTIDDAQPQGLAGPDAAISAHAVDGGSGVDPGGWRIAVDGVDMTAAADIEVSGALVLRPLRPWGEGEHVVRVTAADRSGNRSVRTWTFALPVTPPPPPVAPPTPVDPPAPPTAPEAQSDPVEADPVRATATQRAKALRLRAGRTRIRAGGVALLRGSAVGLEARAVRIEARVGRRWRPVLILPIAADGTFATTVRLPAAGVYDVRARVGAVRSRAVRLVAR